MKLVCFQCKKEIGEKAPFADNRASYGLCYWCLRQILERLLVNKERRREGQLWRFVTSTSEA